MKATTQELGKVNNQGKRHSRIYIVFVDDAQYEFDHSPVTGGEIMDAASIPYTIGLIQIRKDGTQKQVAVDGEIHLKPGCRFKRAPRFKRG